MQKFWKFPMVPALCLCFGLIASQAFTSPTDKNRNASMRDTGGTLHTSSAQIAYALSASDSFYECWTHPDGKPDKVARVWASSTDKAVAKAIDEFKLMDIKPIGVNCKTKKYRRVQI